MDVTLPDAPEQYAAKWPSAADFYHRRGQETVTVPHGCPSASFMAMPASAFPPPTVVVAIRISRGQHRQTDRVCAFLGVNVVHWQKADGPPLAVRLTTLDEPLIRRHRPQCNSTRGGSR